MPLEAPIGCWSHAGVASAKKWTGADVDAKQWQLQAKPQPPILLALSPPSITQWLTSSQGQYHCSQSHSNIAELDANALSKIDSRFWRTIERCIAASEQPIVRSR
jgi:hypothetical protein